MVLTAPKKKGVVTMLHDFAHILAYIAKNPAEREYLSCYLYRKQHEDVSFQTITVIMMIILINRERK